MPASVVEDNAKKWSGDHLIEPSLVPGVLFTSFALENEVAGIGDVPRLVKSNLELGGSLLAERRAPTMGWLDFASPVLDRIDSALSGSVSSAFRIVLWGLLASLLSMLVYKWTSNQKRLAALKVQALEIRQAMNTFEGEMEELWPLLRRNLSVAWQRLGLGLFPALIASVPVLLILVWMSNAFSASFPSAGQKIAVVAGPDETHQTPPMHWRGGQVAEGQQPGSWTISWPEAAAPLELVDSDGTVVLTLPTESPVSTIHQKRWWNALIGNPAGYLPSPGDVDAVVLALPSEEFLSFGPSWLRSWMTLFFVVVIIASLGLKFYWRLH